MFILSLSIGFWWQVGVATGTAMLVFTGLMWRPGGPAQRLRGYMLCKYPKDKP